MKTSTKVEKLLEENPFTRNNDKILYIEFIKKYSETYILSSNEEKQKIIEVILEMPKESSITRIRANYQNTLWLYLPWVNTVNNRKKAQAKFREKFKKDNSIFDRMKIWIKKF